MNSLYIDRTAPKYGYFRLPARLLLIALLLAALCVPLAADFAAASSFDPHEQVGHQHNHGTSAGSEGGGFSLETTLFYIVRAIYYAALLLAAGLMLWSLDEPAKRAKQSPLLIEKESSEKKAKWRLYALRALLVASLLYVFLSYRMLMQGYDSDSSEMLRLFTETRTGNSWLAVLLLAFAGFIALKLDSAVKALWALLLLAAESYNGHVLALDALTAAIVSDYIHLVGGALWAGGLMLLLLLWFKDREAAVRFAPKFSSVAWMSIAALTVSGIALTWLMLPSWTYLLYTSWGVMLLIKAALVLGVIGTGYALRQRIKRSELPSGGLLKVDGILMGGIIVIVSVFTYLSPEPHTEPLNYHHMGDTLHYTLQITPNGPGPNEVTVKVWLPEETGEPQQVKLSLKAADRPRKAPIEVPLSKIDPKQPFEFPGFIETDYKSEIVQLPFPGPWNAELTIVDKAGNVQELTIPFRND